MNTPNSSAPTTDINRDIHADPAASDEFGTNVGMMIEKEPGFRAEPRRRASMRRRTCNVGRTEQQFRLGAGTALLAAAVFAPVSRGWKMGFLILGATELITGSTRYCPISQALGINTCGDEG